MKVKNPEIIEKILLAESDKRLEMIRENAEKLTVSDLNEISLRLIENLTSSVESYDKAHKEKKIEALSRKKATTPKFTKVDIDEELDNELELSNNAEGAPSTESKTKSTFLPFFLIGTLVSVAGYLLTFFINPDFAPFAPLGSAILFGLLGILGKPAKPALLASVIVTTAGNFTNFFTVYNNMTSGNIMSDNVAFFMSIIALALIPISLLWSDAPKNN